MAWGRVTLLLGVLCLCLTSAQVIVKKSVLNTEVTPVRDLVVSIAIFNVGKGAVFDVQLSDDTWDAKFDHKVGLTSAKWERIAAGANVTHSFVLTPKPGHLETNTMIDTSPATVHYSDSPKASPQVCYSTNPGHLRVLSRNAAERRSAPHLKEWGVFAIFSLASILVPFTYWGYAKVAVKKDRKKISSSK